MTTLIEITRDWYDRFEKGSDQRVKDWLFMSSPLPTLAILSIYFIFVTKLGPKLMKNRKPFQLRNTIIFYNGIQVIFSAYLFYESCFTAGWLTDMQWFCQLPDFSMNPRAYAVVRGCWIMYMGKMLDLIDTIFFVLRKKNNQISNLHLFHHMSMPVGGWTATKNFAGGSMSFFVFLNSFVHMVMYMYYFLTALGPHMSKYLWWKRYLTQMQIIQFIAIIVHNTAHLFIKDCAIPKIYPIIQLLIGSTVFLMFLHFYRIEYHIRAKQLQNNVNKRK